MARRPKPPRKPNAAEWLFVVHKRQSELSLYKFVKLFWHAVEPKAKLVDGWVLRAICEHLEAVTDGRLRRLLINVPPGSMKSLLTNVFWPAWEWGPCRRPETRYLTAAYSQGLTERDNERMRQLVNSPLYKAMWGNVFIPGDNKVKFPNDRTGWKIASSVGGTITGERADRVICLPFEALIVTDAGLLPIGTIVHAKLPVRVAGWSGTAVEWQGIEAYEINPAGRLVEIRHDAGVLRCTDDHPVWIEGRGYVPAGEVEVGSKAKVIADYAVPDMRDAGISSAFPQEETASGAVLLPVLRQSLSNSRRAQSELQGGIGGSGLPAMQRAVRTSEVRGGCGEVLLVPMLQAGQSSEGESASGRGLLGVQGDIPSGQSAPAVLFEGMPPALSLSDDAPIGERQEKSSHKGISAGMERELSGEHPRARQSHLPTLSDAVDTRAAEVSGASYRLREGQSGPKQSDLAVPELPRQGSWREGIAIEVESATIRSVRYLDVVPPVTYNVRVGPHHNYFADGMLVHNCDDPNSVHESESSTVRENTSRWLRETMPTRLSNPVESAIIVIQQRTHAEDATGTLLDPERGGDEWVHLMIPARYDPGRHCTTPIGWSDPRGHDEHGNPLADPWENEGAPFWPERFPEDEMEKLEAKLGPYAWSGQMQQMPTPRGGAIIRSEDWQQYGPDDPIAHKLKYPPFSLLVGFVDTAYTTKEQNDPSAMTVMGVWTHPTTGHQKVMLVNAWQARLPLHDLVQRVAAAAKKWNIDALLIENKAAGISLQQEMARLFSRSDFSVRLIDPTSQGSKEARAHSVTHLFSEGMVYAPTAQAQPRLEWVDMVMTQCAQFPRGAHDDLVDCVVSTLRYMRDTGLLNRKQEAKWEEADLHESYRNEGAARPLY